MNNENLSIIDEINEELKNDKQLEFLKKHKNVILAVISAVVVGIVAYSSWHERRKRNMEDITNTLLEIIQNPTQKNDLLFSKMMESAPVELRPILNIIKSGKELVVGEFAEENLRPLLELSTKHGVDIIWKDLALLIYASYPTKPSDELIALLLPLTKNDRPFRFSALEMIALIYENDGKHKEALEYFEKILNDSEAPRTLRERIEMLHQYVRNNIENK